MSEVVHRFKSWDSSLTSQALEADPFSVALFTYGSYYFNLTYELNNSRAGSVLRWPSADSNMTATKQHYSR